MPVSGILEPLSQVLRATREAAGVTQIAVATQADVNQSVVSRFETATRWPEVGPDRPVCAYAEACEAEWLELWERAIGLARSGR